MGLSVPSFSSSSSRKARRDARRLAAQGEAMVGAGFDEAKGYWQPQYDYGQETLNAFQDWREDPTVNDPSYQFRLDQGTEALENSAIARGGLLSGNAMKGITDYAQGAASQEYGNEFDRYMQLLGYGQNATAAMGDLAANKGLSMGSMRAGRGQQNFQNSLAASQQGLQSMLGIGSMFMGGGGEDSGGILKFLGIG